MTVHCVKLPLETRLALLAAVRRCLYVLLSEERLPARGKRLWRLFVRWRIRVSMQSSSAVACTAIIAIFVHHLVRVVYSVRQPIVSVVYP